MSTIQGVGPGSQPYGYLDSTTGASGNSNTGALPGVGRSKARRAHHHGAGRAAFNSALEQLLGDKNKATALEQQIQDTVSRTIQGGGSMADVRKAVDEQLTKAGVDPQKLAQLMHASVGNPAASPGGDPTANPVLFPPFQRQA